jgi:hypothetical protein
MLSTDELLKHATQFDFDYIPNRKISIKQRSLGKWCISLYADDVWDKELKMFVWEPEPSSRTDEFLRVTRFSLEEAVGIVEELLTEEV